MRKRIYRNLFLLIVFAAEVVYTQPILNPALDARNQLLHAGLIHDFDGLKLHLGCGQNYLQGYINIDFPPSAHTVQLQAVADVFADIATMRFPEMSVQEVRLHHVFEHFDRPMALALLCAWHIWLKQEGELCIEVPDFETSIKMLLDNRYSYEQKQVIMRHVFGSHEAPWAIHCDGWYREKFEHVLKMLGFEDVVITNSSWLLTHNITIRAKKRRVLSRDQLMMAVYKLLCESMVDTSFSEQRMCQQWLQKVDMSLGNLLV